LAAAHHVHWKIGMQASPGEWINDRVRLVELLGCGSMGDVWLGEHVGLGIEVAVKLIAEHNSDDDRLARFHREATAAQRIDSPCVVRIFEHGSTPDGTPYIVMERLRGESLDATIERRGALAPEAVARIARQVGAALDAAHACGVIHRDIKPQNIFVVDDDTMALKVVDFGSAKLRATERQTRPDMVVGSPAYLSRDVLIDPDDVDRFVDLWGLSATLYKCVSGKLPFDGRSVFDVCSAVIDGRLRRLSRACPGLPPELDAWFARAFDFDKRRRPESGAALAQSFASVVHRPRHTPLDMATSVTARVSERRHAWWAAAAALPFVLAGALWSMADVDQAGVLAAAPTMMAIGVPRAEPATFRERANTVATTAPVMRSSAHRIAIDDFEIDRTEVTVTAYAQCVSRGTCSARDLNGFALGGPKVLSDKCNWGHPARHNHPINCVSYREAEAYCAWNDARLPSEAEWERAARGDDQRPFPWGDAEASCARAVMSEGPQGCRANGTWPAGSKALGASPFGVLDMAGNVREWTARDADGRHHGRGGSWGNAVAEFVRIDAREALDPATRSIHLGFRCAR
jgi:serine/threonine-protein kinase